MSNSVARQVRLKRAKQTFQGHETLHPSGCFTSPRGKKASAKKVKPMKHALMFLFSRWRG